MKKRNCVALLGLITLISACYPTSINPFYKDQDVSFDSRLLGEWKPKDDASEVWNFTKDKTNAYQLTITTKDNKKGEFSAVLFKLNKRQYLDLIPSKCDFASNQYDIISWSMVPSHLLAHVTKTDPELEIAFFDADWLHNYLTNSPRAIAHTVQDGRIILTAETKDLQRFVTKHQANLFTNYATFTRSTATAPQ